MILCYKVGKFRHQVMVPLWSFFLLKASYCIGEIQDLNGFTELDYLELRSLPYFSGLVSRTGFGSRPQYLSLSGPPPSDPTDRIDVLLKNNYVLTLIVEDAPMNSGNRLWC